MKTLDTLQVCEYELLFDEDTHKRITIQMRRGFDCIRWSINKGSRCLCTIPNKKGQYVFVPEPIPSSRNKQYFYEHRFASAQEAFDFWQQHRNKIIATLSDSIKDVPFRIIAV